MKRKTNLFYTTGPDSKFLTFSNYTESLTGNFLSTDTKLFPSIFIALYIKGLNADTKPALIKYLADYYESKLAALRDYFNYNKGDIEKSVPPLNYLLEALLRIRSISKDNIEYDHSIANQLKDDNGDYEKLLSYTDVVKFKYISDITEQDYNGTFTDTICNIDLRKFAYISSVELTDDFNDFVVKFDMPGDIYGWDGDVPSEYVDERTIPDSVQGIDLDLYLKPEETVPEDEPAEDRPDDEPTEEEEEEEHDPVIYVINSGLPNTVNIPDKVIDYVGDNDELRKVRLTDMIDSAMREADTTSYATALSYILHSNTPSAEVLKTELNNKLSDFNENADSEFILFFDESQENIIYKYDGADVTELDMTENNEYNVNPEIVKLNINISSDDEMEFNCIIPLYDIVDINYKTNFNTIERIISINGEGEIDLEPSDFNKLYCSNVPLGMWLYTDGDVNDEDTTSMKLYKDSESGFSQSWSLTIASQFKPFPYSSKMASELTTNSNTNAYATFAQVLASQSAMIDNFNKLNRTIADMNDHIRNLESQLANIGTSYNIDNIHREFNNFEINMNNKFGALKDEVINQLSYLRWKTTI